MENVRNSYFTYYSQFEYLTDFRVCRDLTLKIPSISGIGKFQLQSVLSSSEEKFTEDFIEKSFNRHRHIPSRDQLKSLIIDVFFISDK